MTAKGMARLKKSDLFDNPSPRLPIALVLDRSLSMTGETSMGAAVQQTNPSPIALLNEALGGFVRDVGADEIARYSANIAIIGFSGRPEVLSDFIPLELMPAPTLEVDKEYPGTSLGTAVNLALDLLATRKREYQEAGVDYYQPWLVIMTDGQPTDDSHVAAAQASQDLITSRRLVTFPVGIGAGADLGVLAMFADPRRPPMSLRDFRFKEFFQWLSQSVQVMSASMPGTTPPLLGSTAEWTEQGPDADWSVI